MCQYKSLSVHEFIGRIAPHFADSILEMHVLAMEIVLWFFSHGIVVLRALEVETQESLRAVATIARSGIDEQHQIEAEWCGKDGVATEKIDFTCMG